MIAVANEQFFLLFFFPTELKAFIQVCMTSRTQTDPLIMNNSDLDKRTILDYY